MDTRLSQALQEVISAFVFPPQKNTHTKRAATEWLRYMKMLIIEWRRPDPIHSNICSLKYTNILYYAGSPLSIKERLQWNNRCPRTPGKVVPHLCVNYIRSPFSDNKRWFRFVEKRTISVDSRELAYYSVCGWVVVCGRGMRPCSRTDMLAYAGVQLADVQSKQLVAMAYRKLINVKSLQNLKSIDLFTGGKKNKALFFEGIPQWFVNITLIRVNSRCR